MSRPRIARLGHSLGASIRTPRRSIHATAALRIHRVPPLPYNFSDGIDEFLTPAAVKIAWNEYQSLMVDKLNEIVSGETYETKSPKDIAIKFARDPNAAPTFNYASMAHNNNFFFSGLSPHEQPIPELLKKELEASFSSIETLKREMTLAAAMMFGPGFVWLVQSNENLSKRHYYILTTYLAGSPYAGAHYRKQSVDMNTESSESVKDLLARSSPANTVGSHGPLSEKPKVRAPGGMEVNPILCINTWEHVYLPDYGLGRKLEYANRWWARINWRAVANNAGHKEATSFQR